jgi:hypothetical protein
MKKFWEQLKPQERRWLIFIGFVVFATMNYFFVWPQFKEWSKNTNRMNADKDNMAKYSAELAHKAEYERKIRDIDPEDQNIAQEDQAVHFEQVFRDKAVENGVQIQSTSRPLTRTDDFTMEQRTTIQVLTGERNLVDYLYSLGSSGSAVRVESMSLRPLDLNRYQLHADLTIVESYFRNPTSAGSARTAAAAPGAPAASARTAATAPGMPAPKPGSPGPRVANPLTPTNKPGLIKN